MVSLFDEDNHSTKRKHARLVEPLVEIYSLNHKVDFFDIITHFLNL